MKLMADVIDMAIDKYLWDGNTDRGEMPAESYSCCAVDAADRCVPTEIKSFLQSMGMNPVSMREFSSIPSGPKRQFARALWLTWAAMIAREEGEVPLSGYVTGFQGAEFQYEFQPVKPPEE